MCDCVRFFCFVFLTLVQARGILTLEDVAALELLHCRPLAQSPAEKHQNYVLDHLSPLPLGSSSSTVYVAVCRY